ncbi:hypothetical protein, partial [Roseibium sp.]|uniref:hypothetical protein n=1 Tax=Roseibium sp. TaxID=1936156 RepID=UPI003299E351
MSVIAFPKQTSVFQPVAHYVRLGETSYRKVADLAASGVIQSKRFVVDGSKIAYQKDIIQMLQGLGAEIVLDPRIIELSARRKCAGLASTAPWASETRGYPLSPEVFRNRHPADIYGAIARCAVEHGDGDRTALTPCSTAQRAIAPYMSAGCRFRNTSGD